MPGKPRPYQKVMCWVPLSAPIPNRKALEQLLRHTPWKVVRLGKRDGGEKALCEAVIEALQTRKGLEEMLGDILRPIIDASVIERIGPLR